MQKQMAQVQLQPSNDVTNANQPDTLLNRLINAAVCPGEHVSCRRSVWMTN